MATWKPVSGEPVTTESEIRVFNVDTGEEGFVRITWENRCHKANFFGPVVKVERNYDDSGYEISAPTRTVLDREPIFA